MGQTSQESLLTFDITNQGVLTLNSASTARIGAIAGHGNHSRTVCAHRALPAPPARQCCSRQFAGGQCHVVRSRAGLQVAWPAQAVRQLAHDLHANASLDQGGRAGQDLRGTAARLGGSHRDVGCVTRLHQHQGTSRWYGRAKEDGPQSTVKSHGG
jgi:hypothetical protein